MSPARGDRELIEVLLQGWAGRAVLVRPREKIDHDLAGTRDLAQTRDRRAMPRVVQHQVQQLESPYSAA